jgi:hypothetical protein
MRRWGVGLLAVGVSLVLAAPSAEGQDPTDISTALLRQVCELQWIEGVCAATGYPEPQYRSTEDPSPGQPFALRIGAVHNHSGYSDGDPDTRPADYFRAAKEGHNTADGGGDTGVVLDFLLSSEHSDNEKLPVTTAEACIDPSGIPDALAELDLEGILPPLKCSNLDQPDHYRKWSETLAQAIEATDVSPEGVYDGFTAMRGFEWTNDYFNHMGVYFSRNVTNTKLDGSLLTMDVLWSWLREPAETGGGDDALVVFNHPGGWPALTPFDGDLPHNQLLNDTLGGANWNDLRYVPDVDERVVGIEVNGGDDLGWYVKALTRGWHLGPVAAEDEHQREWATSEDGKTLVLTRGRSPRDYYYALQHHRTVRLGADLVDGEPGSAAVFPSVLYWADAPDIQDPNAVPLGATITTGGTHTLHLAAAGLPAESPAVLLSLGAPPMPFGETAADGSLHESVEVAAPDAGGRWWFAVVCPPGTQDCGVGEAYSAVTAPIWLTAASATAPVPAAPRSPAAPATPSAGRGTERLPATGGASGAGWPAAIVLGALVLAAVRRRTA